MERSIVPYIEEDHFFDDIFEEMNRDAMRVHHDMRNAMLRLSPRDRLAPSVSDNVHRHMKKLRHPMVTRDDGTEVLQMRLDLSNYKPEEITIKTKGNELFVHAKHEEKTDHSSVHQEFSRKFNLPKTVDQSALKSTLSRDGILTITGTVEESLEPPPKRQAIDPKK